ncbi:MAG: iron-containing alcohol dehydrogenase [Deltaproteobacteria bacterium]|nr:iron-containing alcohol dehydrogenase [Deltaproteobacteria bacterium]
MFQTMRFRTPVIILGMNAVNLIGEEIKKIGGKNVFIITDRGVVQAGILEKILEPLRNEQINFDVFDQVEPEPPLENLMEAFRKAKSCKVDLFIALGGGSSMDMTKVVSALMVQEADVRELFGVEKVTKPGLPTIMVPTTSGTGSEVTRMAVFTDKAENLKKVVSSHAITANVAIVDPMLTVTMPPKVTASTGIDAFIHAVESYVAINASPITDPIALEATRLIAENLGPAVANGQDLRARYNMSMGSLMAGVTLNNAGVGAVHALAYPVGAEYHVPHGVANVVTFAATMEYISIANIPKFVNLAKAMGEPVYGISSREAATRGIKAMQELAEKAGLPCRLRDIGARPDKIPAMAIAAFREKRLLGNTPRQLAEEDIRKIFENSF